MLYLNECCNMKMFEETVGLLKLGCTVVPLGHGLILSYPLFLPEYCLCLFAGVVPQAIASFMPLPL